MLLLAGSMTAFTLKKGESVTLQGDTYVVKTTRGTITVTPVDADIFRVSSFPAGASELTLPESQSATLNPSAQGIASFVSPGEFTLVSESTIVKVNRKTGRTIFTNLQGDTLLSEQGGVENSAGQKRISFLTGAQNFYGAGERGHSLALNSDTLVMFNRQNYGYTGSDPRISQMGITVPYFASDKGYGVLFDDYNEATLTLNQDSAVYTSDTPKPLSYYFINGRGNLAGTTSAYTRLSGRQPLPPLWALGYITSKYGYHNQQEALGAVDSLKRAGYPVDGIIFDLYWYGVETDMGRLAWDPKQFPDHRAMLDSLNTMGVNTILISQPYINKIGAIDNYNELAGKGMLTKDAFGKTHDVTTWVGEAGMFDISNPETRTWLWERLRPLTAEGLAGWWGDLGEPEVHPLTIMHSNGESASQYHNVYGNEWSRLIYEGLRRDFPEMRPVLLMRGGTAGLQRYAVFPWTTDVSRSWGGFEPQIKLMLNSGLSGLGYMSSDIGGFAVDPDKPYLPELYLRWLQMGTFTPVLRTHAQYKPEPYHYPQYHKILKRFIEMRYEWLPYNYTLAYENARYGYPLARPLNFRNSSDTKLADVEDEYLWGDEVLVAPMLKEGARTRKVLFPEGEWIDWNNPALRYRGGSIATVKAPLDVLPLFVKAGSFIPQYEKKIENTNQYDPSELTVKYFPTKEESSYTLFDDDRRNPENLSSGDYRLTTFRGWQDTRGTYVTIKAEGKYPGMPEKQKLTLMIIGIDRPANVSVGKWSYDAKSRTLKVTLDFDGEAVCVSATS